MNNSTEKRVVSDVSVNTILSSEKRDRPFFDIERQFLNFETELWGGLIDTIEMGEYFSQDSFSIIYYFNHSGLRIRSEHTFTSLECLNNFLKYVSLNNKSSVLYLTWSRRKKIPVLVS